ncbi:MAG: DUF721 domain-containing protein [Bacteroidota bacterium]
MMKEDPIKSFDSAFRHFLKEEQLEQTYKQKQIIADWEQIMGKTIASRTKRLFFSKKILFVEVSSAPLKSEMFRSKEKMIELIAKEIGQEEIKEIRFL